MTVDIDGKLTIKNSDDAFGPALLVAVAAHAFLIMSISFDVSREQPPPPERTLDITLVQPKAKPKPVETPDFLAQQNQEGGGEELVRERQTSPLGNPAAVPNPQPAVELERSGAEEPEPEPEPAPITTAKAKRVERVQPPKPEVREKPRTQLSQLLASTQREIDRLTAELDRRTLSASHQDRRKAVNASTQEYRYAAYLESWRSKVEKIGNLNYPDEAKRRRLYGNLLMHVAVRADGSVERIRVVRSSGHKLLDDAAVRIVRMSAPFAPFPPDIRKEVDVLDITRTWQFLDGNTLFSSN
ncbi:MAG: energy transducer TonB [Gammaproteobacteria bacterium]|nr:energy transducer TonB [Gammaproteobacteria bacterium]MCB1926077.1 energy transducer TonB [Gammaproteobacteria bacterium]